MRTAAPAGEADPAREAHPAVEADPAREAHPAIEADPARQASLTSPAATATDSPGPGTPSAVSGPAAVHAERGQRLAELILSESRRAGQGVGIS